MHKLIKAISEIIGNPYFGDNTKGRNKVLRLKKIGIMDPANVCMIQSKSDFGKRVLSLFVGDVDKDGIEIYKRNSKMNVVSEKTVTKGSQFAIEYLDKINSIFKESSEIIENETCTYQSPRIYVADDYPLVIEDAHFRITLAPRVYNE
ncbi:MAG: hypothetical protein ACOCUR_02125 [Nanoarchaeota archaeon]